MEREVRAQMAEKRMSFDESIELLEKKLQAFGVRTRREKLEQGWTESPDGYMVPPGYAPVAGGEDPGETV